MQKNILISETKQKTLLISRPILLNCDVYRLQKEKNCSTPTVDFFGGTEMNLAVNVLERPTVDKSGFQKWKTTPKKGRKSIQGEQ